MLKAVFVRSDDGLYARVDTCLSAGCCLFDTHLWKSSLDSFSHTAELLDFLNVLPRLVHEFVGQCLHVVRTCPWVDFLADFCLVLDVNLRVTCDTCREIGRQSNRFVKRIGVQ